MSLVQSDLAMPEMPQFKPDFTGENGEYYRSIKRNKNNLTTETMKGPDGKPWPTGRRWLQFLHGAREISSAYMEGAKVDIEKMALQYGCTLIPFSDPFATELNLEPSQQKFLKHAAFFGWKKKKINGFSDPIKRKIFYSERLDKKDKRFVLAHEFCHFILGHNSLFFCRMSNDKKPQEPNDYHEESDRMAAILLMPHEYIKDNLGEENEKIAQALEVPVKAVEKRKDEVYSEIFTLSYGWCH
jgi:hypothetical protein